MPPFHLSDGCPDERAFRDHLREAARGGDDRPLPVLLASRAAHGLAGLWHRSGDAEPVGEPAAGLGEVWDARSA